MSLVVAQLTKNGPRIVSDTWISFPYESKLNSKKGVLKAIVVTPEIAICFAGNINAGLKGVRQFAEGIKANQPIDKLLHDLASEGKGHTDYIIANTRSNSKLIRIRDGNIESNLESTWIGDQVGFSRFQEERNKLLNDERHLSIFKNLPESSKIVSILSDAMRAVIEDSTIESVDGFCVTVASEKGEFNYRASTFIQVGRDFQIKSGDDLISKMAQPVTDGGYAISIVEPAFPGTPALCINFPQARIGMIYLPLKYDEAQIMKDISPNDFSKAVFELYGIMIREPLLR